MCVAEGLIKNDPAEQYNDDDDGGIIIITGNDIECRTINSDRSRCPTKSVETLYVMYLNKFMYIYVFCESFYNVRKTIYDILAVFQQTPHTCVRHIKILNNISYTGIFIRFKFKKYIYIYVIGIH